MQDYRKALQTFSDYFDFLADNPTAAVLAPDATCHLATMVYDATVMPARYSILARIHETFPELLGEVLDRLANQRHDT